jgi:NADH:ubiquinone oxidoreductase subunit 2 (subunit N)
MTSFRPMSERWLWQVWGCALATMIIGNFAALLRPM